MRGTRLATRPKTRSDGIIPAYAGNTHTNNHRSGGAWDHPRVCGEHWSRRGMGHRLAGSSPRMRGTHVGCGAYVRPPGIIPAYAGNTPLPARKPRRRRDHPRVCGEHVSCSAITEPVAGSSPRMRGTPFCQNWLRLGYGIIPAYAGNTSPAHPAAAEAWDHPRVCGEHAKLLLNSLVGKGSSPRMRGTHPREQRAKGHDGIIPAYAGNTARSRGTRRQPRGSSPRMRGTPDQRADEQADRGIIPAYAGNTIVDLRPGHGITDHPRVCGEHLNGVGPLDLNLGSSPRMRGTPVLRLPLRLPVGIIPAYAGNTAFRTRGVRRFRDHPRVCGEHPEWNHANRKRAGSSPRMRGTRPSCDSLRAAHGIIPAYAGNTCRLAPRRRA